MAECERCRGSDQPGMVIVNGALQPCPNCGGIPRIGCCEGPTGALNEVGNAPNQPRGPGDTFVADDG